MKRPNILFLMSDEHRADVTGYEGNDIIRTPNLDKLAKTGVVFSNAYTPSPICVPGRQALMSGQFPRTCGCENYGQDLPPSYMTFSRHFAQNGYETVVSGKLHHMGYDQMQGWTKRICGDMHTSYKLNEELTPVNPTTIPKKWSDAKEIARAGIGRSEQVAKDELTIAGAKQFIMDYFNNSYYDRESGDKPLMLKVSVVQPHYPYITSEDNFNYYLNRVNPYIDEPIFEHPFLRQREVTAGKDVSERELRRATAAYYGMIDTIDGYYGEILDTLELVGQNLDDWIIIYSSDHGEMLGQHGIWEKQKFFEASVRVPLIIRWPKSFDGSKFINENVNLCDIFATLCELCNINTPNGLDSRSLVPLLNRDTSNWDNETVSQFRGKNLMIKRDNLKYQFYGDDMPEVLFDLERNPEETINYIDDPKYAQKINEFRKRSRELGF